MLLHRLHGIDAQRADAIDGQPRTVQNTSVAQHPLGDSVEDLLIDPTHQTAGQEDQKQVTQAVHIYFSSLNIYTILHSIFLSFDFYSEAKRVQPLFLSQSQSKTHKTRVTPPKRVIYPVKPSFHPSSNIKPTQSRIV